jgi:phenylacetaldehyde dehydrogenase
MRFEMTISEPDPRLSRSTREFLKRGPQMLIDGKLVGAASGKTYGVTNPATGKVFIDVPEGDKEDVDRAVKAARRAFDDGSWAAVSPSQRGQYLWRLADLLEKNGDELAEIESLDNGKAVTIARAADVALAVDHMRYMAGLATKITGTTIPVPGNLHSMTYREPVGVVGQIIPWNFPLLMAVWKIAPAVAAGCTVVLKVAEETPLSGLRLAELVAEANFPPGVVNVITGFGETAGAALVAHPMVDKVAFTGSTEVGKLILKAASVDLKRVSLELGGKSPAIVFPDADLSKAIPGVGMGIFFNSGQTCCAGSVLYAHEKVFDELVAGITEVGRGIKMGPGLNPDTQLGPLVSETQYKRVTGYIAAGQQAGAKIHAAGAGQSYGAGYFVEPAVITNTKPDMSVVREEIFGPVLVAQSFNDDDLERMAARANSTIYGLAASVWTKDLSTALKMSKMIKAGTVWVNCHNTLDAAVPFGGYKQSGWGRENSELVLHSYTETKAVTIAL